LLYGVKGEAIIEARSLISVAFHSEWIGYGWVWFQAPLISNTPARQLYLPLLSSNGTEKYGCSAIGPMFH